MNPSIKLNSLFTFVRQLVQCHRICFLCFLVLISTTTTSFNQRVLCDDSMDLSSLANLGASLGINSQMIGALSSLLNQPSKQSNVASLSDTLSGLSEQDSGSILSSDSSQTQVSQEPAAPPKSASHQPTTAQAVSQTGTVSVSPSASTPSSGSSSLGSIASMLPNLLSRVNLNGLGGLLSGMSKSSPSSSSAVSQATVAIPSSTSAQLSPTNISAQSVVNQVLTAYASGQIPNELIQLGLSGRVPAAIVELALSGQVPPQLIQMVITGQVPVTTIKAFLNAMDISASTMATAAPGVPVVITTSKPSSLTRSIFEALFRPVTGRESEKRTITVPTLFGSVPIQLSGLPNIKRIGQFVGGTITNVASMIPF